MTIGEKVEALKKEVAALSRPENPVRIILVTKTVEVERIREALQSGLLDLGENRVQELLEKKKVLDPEMPGKIRWHLIGHLQTNKVKQVVGEVELIHSLDRLELAQEIEKQAAKRNIAKVPCLIQVNTSGEETKFGVAPEKAAELAAGMTGPAVEICGLMTIGPLTDDEAKIRESFRKLKSLQQELKKKFPKKNWDTLSMGMSGDYPAAIAEGATMIRVGTAMFGERKKG